MDKSALIRLQEIGFELAGEWLLEGAEPRIDLRRFERATNVLYAFASGSELLFVGRSARSLRGRMDGYEQGGPLRSTRARNRERIQAMLMMDQPVQLYAMPDPGNMLYGSFKVNLAAGLQHSLIEALAPPWNHPGDEPRGGTRARPAAQAEAEGGGRSGYRFLVGYVFLEQGFFNVPQRYAALFGADRQRIKILCGRERTPIYGHIDRSSNTNAAPRIVGGSALARWFAEQAGLNNPVDIDILAPNAVWLRNPETVFK